MKFGHNLHHYQVVEWTAFYIDYKVLKRLYKDATKAAVERGEDADFTEFTAAVEHNFRKVESFYKTRHAIIQQRVNRLHSHYGVTESTGFDSASQRELEDLTATFIELRDALKQLQWYELVNFNKIVGRLGKFEGRVAWPPGSNGLKIPDTHLAARTECLKSLRYVNGVLVKLQSKRAEARPGATKIPLLLRKYYDGLLPSLPLISISSAIDEDNVLIFNQIFEQSVKDQNRNGSSDQQRLILASLQLSVLSGSKRCIEWLLARIGALEDFDNHIHWLVIKAGRKKRLHGAQIQAQNTSETIVLGTAVTEAIEQLAHVIRWLGFRLTAELHKKDSFGRLPLHHAVQYGLLEVCQEILKYMKGYEMEYASIASSSALIPDSEGVTALDLAVLRGNAAITELLLEDHRHSTDEGTNSNTSQVGSLPGKLLTTALKSGRFTIMQLLRTCIIDVNRKDYHDETALYLAVRSGRLEYVNLLLTGPDEKEKIDVDAPEAVYGWTPLIQACVKGDLPIAERLLRAGADPRVRDLLGWTAEDHAAFRGYLPMARMLMASDSGSDREDIYFNGIHQEKQHITKGSQSLDFPIPGSLGQDVPPGYSQVYVNLGPLDTYRPVTAVNLSPYVSPDDYDSQREADFQVEICGIDGDQSSHVIQLPILEDMANKPYRFLTRNAATFKLAFNILHADTTMHERGTLIGSAVALLESLKQGLGSTRESLIRDFTVPILKKDTLQFIGTVTFYFLVITPFPHPCPMSVPREKVEFGTHGSPTIIGHRGIGQNDPSRRHLQIGENTIESFLSAMDLGASYIEFDVQLTKDDVPVIYHDFLMSETGIDAPLHSLSLEQFMYISEAQSTPADLPSLAEKRYLERCGEKPVNGYKSRSYSLNAFEQSRAKSLVERMKHTFEFKLNEYKGYDSYKGNIRGEYIQASFMTLGELFVKLPESVRFDIEIKYPMLFEAHDWKMESYAVEVNHLVDTVLDKVYRLAGNRTIFLSSFSPEICILLSTKQNSYPVFFLTESGHIVSADARADSLQEAIHFARSWRLPGVICRSQPLVMSPDLVKYVKDSGLLCISWGELNDEPEHAKTQANAGLDAIIVNSVNLISRTLSKVNAS